MNQPDEPNEFNVDINTKASRDDLKCTPCRVAKKKCKARPDGDGRCQRCIELKRPCSELTRVLNAQPVTLITRELATLLLSSCRISCRNIYCVIHPYPETREFETGFTPLGSSSSTLSCHTLGFLAFHLAIMQQAFAEIVESLNAGVPDLLEICLSVPRCSRMQHDVPLIEILNDATAISKAASLRSYNRSLWLDFQVVSEKPLDAYEAAAASLCELFRFVDENLSSKCKLSGIDLRRGFPAGHIAMLSGDRSAALKLWQMSPNATDLLGRSMEILAAESNDLNFLKAMHNLLADDTNFPNCKPSMDAKDHRNLSALAILTTLGFEASFDYVFACRPSLHSENDIDRYLIDLAFASGSQRISQSLLQDGRTLIPVRLLVYFQEAIELGRADLTACLVQRLLYQFSRESPEISGLKILTRESILQMQASQREAFSFCLSGNHCTYWSDIMFGLENRIQKMETLASCLREHDHRMLASQAAINDVQKLDVRTVYNDGHNT